MIYAIADGRRISPAKHATGTCPHCLRRVIAKCGNVKVAHWAHVGGENDCDPWAESETRWHRDWQLRADPSWCEVTMGENREHRADIRRPRDGLVIELQHSYIGQEEVQEREDFYGNMFWVFDTTHWRFRLWLEADGSVHYRWMSRRHTLDAAKCPVFLDVGGPLLHVTGFGRQGCVSGTGSLLTRSAFINMVGMRPLAQEELLGTSHYTMDWGRGRTLLTTSLELLQEWRHESGLAMHHDLGGGTRIVEVPKRRSP